MYTAILNKERMNPNRQQWNEKQQLLQAALRNGKNQAQAVELFLAQHAATHASEIAAATSGVDTDRLKVQALVLSAVFASLAGSLYAHFQGAVSPSPFSFKASVELLVMADALRRASAERITAVIPYFGYARQDRKHEGRVPITAKLVANLIATAGIDRVLTVDLQILAQVDVADLFVVGQFLEWNPLFLTQRRNGPLGQLHPGLVNQPGPRQLGFEFLLTGAIEHWRHGPHTQPLRRPAAVRRQPTGDRQHQPDRLPGQLLEHLPRRQPAEILPPRSRQRQACAASR